MPSALQNTPGKIYWSSKAKFIGHPEVKGNFMLAESYHVPEGRPPEVICSNCCCVGFGESRGFRWVFKAEDWLWTAPGFWHHVFWVGRYKCFEVNLEKELPLGQWEVCSGEPSMVSVGELLLHFSKRLLCCAVLLSPIPSDSLKLHGLWDSPGKNIDVGSHALPQGIFPTQGSNPGLPHCRQILYCPSSQGSPILVCACALIDVLGHSANSGQTYLQEFPDSIKLFVKSLIFLGKNLLE